MKKRMLITIIISLICAGVLTGCGKSTDNSDLTDKMKDKAVAATQKEKKEDEPENSEKKEEKTDEEAPKGVPEYLLFRQNEYKYSEDSTPAIKHQYTYLVLDGNSAKSYEHLASSLEDARDEILSMQKKTWNDDVKMIEENDRIVFDESWMTYIRRADDKYVSFVTEYCGEGMFDDGAYTKYTAHSYYVESGKEIAFSDVISDEDAFFDLLSEKMYESISNKIRLYYSSEIADDKEKFENDLKDLMKSGDLVWTLDPFGVTCYLASYTKAPFAESAVIQFSEDADNVIFTDEFRKSAKDEYVIQVPGYAGSYIDVNDSGVAEYVNVSEFYDYNESYDDMELSGLHLSCGGDWKNIPMTTPGGTPFYNIFLIHKDGGTVVLESHDEYDTSFINTYVLARHEVREAGSVRGCLEWASQKDYDINGEGYTPVYVPTDPSKIRVLTGNGDYAQDWSPTVISPDSKGNIEGNKTGSSDGYRVYYYLYSEGENVEVSKDKVTLREVSCVNADDEDDEGPMDLVIDADTVFDESCDTSFFDGYQNGDTPLEWIHHARELEDKEPDRGPLLLGVYEVSLTGNHIDRYYGAYWWD